MQIKPEKYYFNVSIWQGMMMMIVVVVVITEVVLQGMQKMGTLMNCW
jgi:hypothetical protein